MSATNCETRGNVTLPVLYWQMWDDLQQFEVLGHWENGEIPAWVERVRNKYGVKGGSYLIKITAYEAILNFIMKGIYTDV